MLLSEAIDELIIATKANGRMPQTVEGYRRKLKPLLTFLGDVPVEQITVGDLRRYIIHLQERSTLWAGHPKHQEREGNLSPFTVASHIRATQRLFNWLKKERIIQSNPMEGIEFTQPKEHWPKAISADDFQALLETTKSGTIADIRDRAIIFLLADSGCRISGLCGLRVEDINLTAGRAMVTEKGLKTRLIFFDEEAKQALEEWLKVRPNDQGPWLFISLGNKAKGRLSPNGVRQMLKRRAKLAGVRGPVNPHAFRHAFAREYLSDEGDMGTLSRLMGHSNTRVTDMFYARYDTQVLKRAHKQHSPVARMLGKKQKADDQNT